MMKAVLVLTGVIIIAFGGYYFLNRQSKPAMEKVQETVKPAVPSENAAEIMPQEEITNKDQYTLDKIAGHNQGTDCWFAIEGKVYDVTEFIAGGKHPGKDAILQGCGKDATELFNTRPMGSGAPHSDKAREMLFQYEIGTLKQTSEQNSD